MASHYGIQMTSAPDGSSRVGRVATYPPLRQKMATADTMALGLGRLICNDGVRRTLARLWQAVPWERHGCEVLRRYCGRSEVAQAVVQQLAAQLVAPPTREQVWLFEP